MPTPKNERETENVVRDELRRLGYYKKGIVVEEQRSEIATVKRSLRAASKSGQGGAGAPEFIVSAPANADFLLVIECKADPKDHISDTCKNVQYWGGVRTKTKNSTRSACSGMVLTARCTTPVTSRKSSTSSLWR